MTDYQYQGWKEKQGKEFYPILEAIPFKYFRAYILADITSYVGKGNGILERSLTSAQANEIAKAIDYKQSKPKEI